MAEKFSAEERDAMKERAKELKAAAKGKAAEDEVLAKIAEMPADQRAIATRIHEIVREVAPQLAPKTWYGQPAYANADGQVVCFFQSADKFKTRYCTLGFNEAAQLDDGGMWATAFAIVELDDAAEQRVAELVRRAAG